MIISLGSDEQPPPDDPGAIAEDRPQEFGAQLGVEDLPVQAYVAIVREPTYPEKAMPTRKKLTLSVDTHVIERARRYSRRHNTSISRLVSNYLSQLDESEDDVGYSPTVRRLLGILAPDTSIEEYHKHLEEKHSR